jgi:serine/threonine protein kinase
VVHCDLKAANILTTKNGNVKLSDFGVSLNLKVKESDFGAVAGTPNWSMTSIQLFRNAVALFMAKWTNPPFSMDVHHSGTRGD